MTGEFGSDDAGRAAVRAADDAMQIWKRGVAAVDPVRLVRESLRLDGTTLVVTGRDATGRPATERRFDGRRIQRVRVVGAGKAGATMAAAVEAIFLGGNSEEDFWRERFDCGWVNVPAGSERLAEKPLKRTTLWAARPAMANEPALEGVFGTREILRLVGELTADDLCLCLISGGGSALLPAPVEGVTLDELLALTRFLAASGADIAETNTVRKQLSAIQGGRLAMACAAPLVSLILSDVPGDPLDIIASGPTVRDTGTAAAAMEVLEKYDADQPGSGVSESVFRVLQAKVRSDIAAPSGGMQVPAEFPSDRVFNALIGNNATAVVAAVDEATRLGYQVTDFETAENCEGFVGEVARNLVDQFFGRITATLSAEARTKTPTNEKMNGMDAVEIPMMLISGGEPVVHLAEKSIRGCGGRNTQFVLEALVDMKSTYGYLEGLDCGNLCRILERVTVLSGGTDGEDGPTDAAGAIGSLKTLQRAKDEGLDPEDFLRRNDTWTFFDRLGGLIRVGPTGTNVCDLRVMIWR